MEIPETFLTELSVEFQDRLRARYSAKQNSVVIEQKVGRNIVGSVPRKLLSNETRQSLAEGYKPIMQVAVSEVIRCEDCSSKIPVPFNETREVKCEYCKLKGRVSRYHVGFYPLNVTLINHLKSIDPLRNMDKNFAAEMQAQNERIAEQQQKSLYDEAESYANDNIYKLMGIPTKGMNGKIMTGTELKGF